MRSNLGLGTPQLDNSRVFAIARACSQSANLLEGCGSAARVVQDSLVGKEVDLNGLRTIARVFRNLAGLSQAVLVLRQIGHDLNWNQASPTWKHADDQALYQNLCEDIIAVMPTDAVIRDEQGMCECCAKALDWAATLFEKALAAEINLRDAVINAHAKVCYQALNRFVITGRN